jgi:hypothetical protein
MAALQQDVASLKMALHRVGSSENRSDHFTKLLPVVPFWTHTDAMMGAHCLTQCHQGVKWTPQELKRVADSLNDGKTETGVKSYPQLDCVELERFIFPVLHVTLGLANRLLKHAIDYADKVVERTPPPGKGARRKQMEAEQKHEESKQETVDWGRLNGPTLANMHLAQGHLDEEIEVEGMLNVEERDMVIENAASLKEEITSFKKALTDLKKKKAGLSKLMRRRRLKFLS